MKTQSDKRLARATKLTHVKETLVLLLAIIFHNELSIMRHDALFIMRHDALSFICAGNNTL